MNMSKKKIVKKDSKKVAHGDGWMNVVTGLGVLGRDKRKSSTVSYQPMIEQDADDLYSADDIAAKIVDLLPEEAFREGFKIIGLESEDKSELLMEQLKKTGAIEALQKGWQQARLYGGSGVFMVTQNLTQLGKPFTIGEKISAYTVLTRWELFPDFQSIQSDLRKPNFGMPMAYRFQPRMMSTNTSEMIHASRLIRFDGVDLPQRQKIQNQYWGDSILNRLEDCIRNYSTSHDSAATILQDFRIAVFKIKNLADQIAQGNDAAVIKRLQMVDIARSVARAVVIDGEGEDFEYKSGTVTGLTEIIDKLAQRLVAGSRMPHTILLGESPSGSNATGNSTTMAWYDYVSAQQESILKPRLKTVIELVAAGMAIELGDDWDVEFNPLWQMDEKELVENRNKQADTDMKYYEMGVYDAATIAEQRFGEKYSYETKVEASQVQPKVVAEEPVPEAE